MKELILLKSGEIVLKGRNRGAFENLLIRNAKQALRDVGKFKLYKAQSAIYAEPLEGCDLDLAVERLSKVFGFSALSRARIVEKDFPAIQAAAVEYLADDLAGVRTFKVAAKRSDKTFPMTSPDICRELGATLLKAFPHLLVDVHQPAYTVTVEVRDYAAYIRGEQLPGAGGMPVGSGGQAALLLSGGIDSPVAGYMMAKRGLRLIGVHFASPPYTSQRAQHKVETLCRKLAVWAGPIALYTVPFTALQERIYERCPDALLTVLMRRAMMQAAEIIALQQDCGGLITGESVGQVASQTLHALACTDAATQLPVLRPLIGMDKKEIVALSRKIDTYETSILPYDDCCTVFTPRYPKTNPRMKDILPAEEKLDSAAMIAEMAANATCTYIGSG